MLAVVKNLHNPFRHLSIHQRILQIVRLGFPVISFILLIALAIVKNDPLNGYFAQLNCDHLDMINGLVKLLRGFDGTVFLDNPNADIPYYFDPYIPDSTIIVMNNYAKQQAELAPQYLLLGFKSYCTYRYDTNYDNPTLPHINVTYVCDDYAHFGAFDFNDLLASVGFGIVLDYSALAAYDNTAQNERRARDLRVFSIVNNLNLAILPLLIFATLFVYSYRQGASDLSSVSKWLVHIPLILSVVSGASITTSVAIVFRNVVDGKKKVKDLFGGFGMSLSFGPLFFGLQVTIFILLALTMLFWMIPVWCSNPVDVDDETEVLVALSISETQATSKPSRPKFGIFKRKGYASTSSSTNPNEASSTAAKDPKLSLLQDSTNSSSGDLFSMSNREQSELELRKLGDQLSHRPHVRRITRALTIKNPDQST